MFTVMVVFHTLVAVLMVVVILMQSAKGEGLAGAFGGGGGSSGLSGAVFGGRGAGTFLSKATTVLAALFMINCGILAYISAHRTGGSATMDTSESIVTQEAQKEMEAEAARQQMTPMDTSGGNIFQTEGVPAGESTEPTTSSQDDGQ